MYEKRLPNDDIYVRWSSKLRSANRMILPVHHEQFSRANPSKMSEEMFLNKCCRLLNFSWIVGIVCKLVHIDLYTRNNYLWAIKIFDRTRGTYHRKPIG